MAKNGKGVSGEAGKPELPSRERIRENVVKDLQCAAALLSIALSNTDVLEVITDVVYRGVVNRHEARKDADVLENVVSDGSVER